MTDKTKTRAEEAAGRHCKRDSEHDAFVKGVAWVIEQCEKEAESIRVEKTMGATDSIIYDQKYIPLSKLKELVNGK
jgi:hypothetical protein